jgi:hypothetical protein
MKINKNKKNSKNTKTKKTTMQKRNKVKNEDANPLNLLCTKKGHLCNYNGSFNSTV